MKTILDRLPYLPVFAPDPPAGAAASTPPAGAASTPPAGAGADTTKAGAGADTLKAGAGNDSNAFTREPGDKATPGEFPADWREKMATGADGKVDQKELDRLKRFDSPAAVYRGYREAESRLTSGKNKDVPMPDETRDPDGAKKWREERGIPADPTGYTIPDDLKPAFTEADAPLVANYTTFAHKQGMAPDEVNRNLRWYAQFAEQQAADREAADKAAADAVEDQLRKEWGPAFRDNQAAAKKFADEAIPGVPWFVARLPNDPALGNLAGQALGNIPGIMQAFAQLALLKYGDTSFVGGQAAKATDDRMAELKNIMSTDIDKWNASPALRAEYGKLLEAAERRNAAASARG